MTDSKESSPAESTPCRRFNLGDGMILIAAICVGLALGKEAFVQSYPRFELPRNLQLSYQIQGALNAAVYLVEALSVAVLFLRLKSPRPSLLRVVRQPGFFLCGTAVGWHVFWLTLALSHGWKDVLSSLAFLIQIGTGTLVATMWGIIWVSGWFRRERGWIDSLGIALGLCWIPMPLVLWVALTR
jgi:hypothetical protein